jgi:type IV secretory pathway ATPase VirB11/archaellum biosynthesis ATPase
VEEKDPNQDSPQESDEEITAPRSTPPVVHRPESSTAWQDSESDLKPLPPEKREKYSEQSKQIISAIEEGIAEPSCTQIDGYGPGKLSAQVNGENRLLQGLAFSSVEEYTQWLKDVVDGAESVVTWDQILSERMGVMALPGGGRFTVFLANPGRTYPSFSLRKHTAVDWQPTKFVEMGTLDQRMLNFLQACVAAKVNFLFVGEMGSGKTTLLRALASGFGDNEKVAVIEQIPELALNKPLVSEYVYQPTVEGLKLHDVLDYNLYNGLQRLVVGEVHLEGLTKMLETMIFTQGSMSTYHAFSSEMAAERMKLGLQKENGNITAETAAAFIRNAVELVVVLEKEGNQRRVTQVTELDWRASGDKTTLGGRDIFKYDRGLGQHRAHSRPDEDGRIVRRTKDRGIELPQEWFLETEMLERFQRRT